MPQPTQADIAELTAYLPRLYADGFQPVLRWEGGKRTLDGSISQPWPVYDALVEKFFRTAGKICWDDYDYRPQAAAAMIADEAALRSASLDQIKSMLTYCVRSERFSDGQWAALIEEGSVRVLLERLVELGEQMEALPVE